MNIAVPKETLPGERRVALVPADLPRLLKAGCRVALEAGAGAEAGYSDEDYRQKGATIVASRDDLFAGADIVVQVRGYGANLEAGRADLARLRRGQVVVALFEPLTSLHAVREVAAGGATLFALELIPRITRAQAMDVLSSMATLAGYKSVLLAAAALPRMFQMLMTAAGTLTPARVLVIGAGVAGLQAISMARRLGAVVEAYDVRPAVKEQIESLGAKFVELPVAGDKAEDAGGYARAQDEAFYRRQRELLTQVVSRSNVVITTAAVPGMKAPVLVTGDMVDRMTAGSVIVDLAAERGGNCERTRPGETVVVNGVTIMGPLNLPSTLPFHASQMFSRNVTNLLALLIKDGRLNLDLEDQVIRDTMATHNGEITQARIREALRPDVAAARQ